MLGVITARGGSKRLPGKNKKDFMGKPLIAWTIEAALLSRCLSRVVVSTDCAEIAKLSLDYGAEVPFLRDSALAQDETLSSDVLLDVLTKVQKTDCTVLLQPTSPLRHYKHIDKAYELHKSKGPKSTVSITTCAGDEAWFTFSDTDYCICKGDAQSVKNAGKIPVKPNGAVYIVETSVFCREKEFFYDDTIGYMMDEMYSIDIDTEDDWNEALRAFDGG